MTGAAIRALQQIAWLTNQHLGGGCCEKHAQEILIQLHAELAKFEDDSFQVLKTVAAINGDATKTK